MRTIGLLGGSFNPIHIGHIRLAVEVMEALKPNRLDIIPCAQPPHKNAKGFLPFDLRCQLIELALDDLYMDNKDALSLKKMRVNCLEGERKGPSYTWDTLVEYEKKEPDAHLFFVLGGEDFSKLSAWYRGKEIPYLTDIIVVPRDSASHGEFVQAIQHDWPEAQEISTNTWVLPNGHQFMYQPLPRLDISSSLLRRKWLNGRNISFLVPKNVQHMMEQHRSEIQTTWNI